MSELHVRPVVTSNDTDRFIKFLWKIYDGDQHWVPPLLMDRRKLIDKNKNPFYKHADVEFFLAEREGEVVGRIAAIVNHNHIKEHNENIGFFGFFECVNDQQVANTLFDATRRYLKGKGVNAVRGPVNPSVNDEYGLLVDGFDLSPTVLMPYNPHYYLTLIEHYGFKKAKDLYAYLLDQDTVYSERLERANKIVKERNKLVFRSLDMKDFKRDVGMIKEVYNAAWERNWGEVPMTDDEIDAMAKDLKPIVVPDLVIFAEVKNKPIGFALSVPDINIALKYNKKGRLLPGLVRLFLHKKEINLVRIIALGVLPEYRTTGAAGALFYETAVRAKNLGYHYGEASWILEDNVSMVKGAEAMNGTITKRYRIYEMPL